MAYANKVTPFEQYKTQSLHDKKFNFFEKVNALFNKSDDYGPLKSWHIEFTIIKDFIKNMPEEQHEEMFLQVCKSFLEHRTTYSDYKPSYFGEACEQFLTFLAKPEFKPFKEIIPQNIFTNNIYTLLNTCIQKDSLVHAQGFCDIFLLPENKHLQHFSSNNLLGTLLENNQKAGINFLVDNFEGWDNAKVLSSLFYKSSLDDFFLDKLVKKTGALNATNIVAVDELIKRDFPSTRKVQILNALNTNDEPYGPIASFYLKALKSGDLNLEKLQASDDRFISSLKNPDYIKKWLMEDFNSFNSFYESQTGLLENSDIKKLVLEVLQQPEKVNFKGNYHAVLPLLNNVSSGLNTVESHLILVALYENPNTTGTVESSLSKFPINFNLPSDINVNSQQYNSLGAYLTDKNSINYLLTTFNDLPENKKKSSWAKIWQLASENTYSSLSISDDMLQGLYDFARKNKTAREFFQTTFIEADFGYSSFKDRLITAFLLNFSKEKEPLILNLPEENPIYQFIKNHSEKEFNTTYHNLLKALNGYFHNELNDTKTPEGTTVLNYAKSKMTQHIIDMSFSNPKANKGNFFSNLFKSEPIQLVRSNVSCKLITNKNELQVVPETQIVPSNSVDSLVGQALTDLDNFQKLMDQHAEKSLNVEVKIRAENILLNNVNFLKTIEGSVEEIAFEDMYFLKNNLNKYLLQSLNTYAKSVGRYEALLEPGNTLNTKSEEELEKQKEKIDTEALKQIALLEKELDLVKGHIVSQFNQDLLTDMRVTTRVLEGRVEDSESRSAPEPGKIVKIRKM